MAHYLSETRRVSRSARSGRPLMEDLVEGSWTPTKVLTEASYDAYRRRPPYTGPIPEGAMLRGEAHGSLRR